MGHRLISADSHVVEAPDLWERRMDAAYRDRAPHMKREEHGDFFYCEGQPPSNVGILGPAGHPPERFGDLKRFEDNRKGGWDPEARLKDMDADGVEAEVLYPTIGFRMFRLTDPGYQRACFRAYNDWMADLCSAAPKRLAGVALISTYDIEWAVAELQRARGLGLPSGMIAITPDETRPYSDPYYDPLWAAAQDLGMPIGLHILTGANKPGFESFVIDYPATPNWMMRSLAALIFSGVFQRYAGLRVVSVEADIGWIPNFLKRIDHTMRRHGPRLKLDLVDEPSAYFRRNVAATFIDDEAGLRTWDLIGADNIMWSNDYPHTDSSWPNSREVIARETAHLPDDVKAKVLAGNAAALYGFD